jgi:hypothetical protein
VQACPICHSTLSRRDLFLGPPDWKLQCSTCETWLAVSSVTRWAIIGGLLGLSGIAFLLGSAIAQIIRFVSEGRILVTPDWITLALVLLVSVALSLSLQRIVLRVGRLHVYDEAASLQLASRAVMGLLVAILVFLVWVLWRFS